MMAMKNGKRSKDKTRNSFLNDSRAGIIDMPLQLIVSIIIGIVALTIILGYIQGCNLIPEKINLNVSPMSVENNTKGYNTFHINVTNLDGDPIRNAVVILHSSEKTDGLSGHASGKTNEKGYVKLKIELNFYKNFREGFLDIIVKPPIDKYEVIDKENLIKIYESTLLQ